MADLKKAPGGRETPQGELRPEVVEDEVPRSPVAEEPGGGGSNSSETKLSPREEEELDPRIQEELEHLNQASEEINQVELQLDEARTTYRRILQESARKLNTQGSHLGSCIEKARPYYEARRLAKEVCLYSSFLCCILCCMPVFYAVTNTKTKSTLGEEKIYVTYTSRPVHLDRSHLRNSSKNLGRPVEEPFLLAHLRAYTQLAFLYKPEAPAQGMVPPVVGWALLHQLNSQDNPP